MYSELDVVNACLASMGEAPILDLTVPHPYVSIAVRLLSKHNKLVQSLRWWFNSTTVTLVPVAPTYTVAATLPSGALNIIAEPGKPYVLNGDGTVYDLLAGETVTESIDVIVVRELAFTDLPVEANAYVTDCTVLEFQRSYDGDAARTRDLKEQRKESGTQLQAQHIRMMKSNLFRRVASKLNDIRGDRPLLRGQE
jgi:hypothetical protein